MADNYLLEGYLNPLAFTAAEPPWNQLPNREAPTDDDLLRYLCQPGIDSSFDAIVGRYLEISREGNDRIIMAPTGILAKLIWPLRNAKASYALGNYLGTIALCGMAMEMSAMLIFEAFNVHNGISKHKRRVAPNLVPYFKGNKFEREGQQRRVDILFQLNLIDQTMKDKFDLVRDIRRRHLHLMSQPTDRIDSDAVKAFMAAVKGVKHTLGLDVRDGKIALRPEIYSWLESKGYPVSKVE